MSIRAIISSIRFKIAAAFSLVFILIAFATNLIIFQYLRENLLDSQLELLFREAESLVADVGFDPVQIPITNEDQLIYVWYESFNVSYKLYEKAGFPSEVVDLFRNEVIQPEGENAYGLKSSLTIDSLDIVLVDRPLFNEENGFIRLLLSKDNLPLQRQIANIRQNLILANLLSIVLSALLAYIVSGISLRPVQKIINKAGTIQASESMERLPATAVNDEIGQLSGTINDMIERIEQSIKNQNRFFAMAAHELRTPLANMQSELEYRMSTSGDHTNPGTLSSLREEVIRLKNIVQDFLLMSQLKSDSLVLRKSQFRLDDLVYDTLERMRPIMTRHNFEIKLSIDAEKFDIHADREKLEAVLVNLFDNARKYGDNNGPVEVAIRQKAESVLLIISNGVPDTILEVQKGMGLGLQIAKRIMQKHGYGFEVTKSKLSFTITLSIPQNGW